MGLGSSRFEHHEHPMRLREDPKLNEDIKCKLCAKSVDTPFYVCYRCKYYIHKSCQDLPLQIILSFHPSHALHLFGGVSTWCNSCFKDFKNTPFYDCKICNLKMDVKCATMALAAPSKEEGQQNFLQHFSHPHSLSLELKHNVKCYACQRSFSGLAYGCAHCSYFLHKSCAEFPQETTENLLHPNHNKFSLGVSGEDFTCSICETTKKSRCNFKLRCNQCDFRLCWKCHNEVKTSIECEDHEHKLFIVEKTGDDDFAMCNGYDAYCRRPDLIDDSDISKEFKRSTLSSLLKCAHCHFKFHLLCGPLPSSIKHECHIHSLTLHDSIIEDDSGEYYCDVCETERDPRIRIYYCEECKFFAHVGCVISKITNALKEETNGVELKALGKETWSRKVPAGKLGESTALSLKDLIDRLPSVEKAMLESSYTWDHNISSNSKDIQKAPKQERSRLLTDKDIEDTLRLSRFTDLEFVQFCLELRDHCISIKTMEFKQGDLGLKLVKVKGYYIPRSLADVLKTLFHEYGDYIAYNTGNRSLEMRSILFFVLCQVVKRMSDTMVKDITKQLLREWYFHLRVIKNWGFVIEFALTQFESLVDAFLGFQVHRLETEIPAELNRKIVELRRRLKKCKEFRGPSERPMYMKYCLNKASELKWKEGFACLPGQQGETFSIPRKKWDWKY